MDTKEPFVIISAERKGLTLKENGNRTVELGEWLYKKDFAYDMVLGCYKGTEEHSFIVLVQDGTKDFYSLAAQAAKYNQESILVVGSNREASLYFISEAGEVKDIQGIGHFVNLSEKEAKSGDAWTKRNDYYYGVRAARY